MTNQNTDQDTDKKYTKDSNVSDEEESTIFFYCDYCNDYHYTKDGECIYRKQFNQ